MRVGLYGGTFDPAHAGHIHVAREARRRLGLDRVIWLVTPGNPLKSGAARKGLAARLDQTRRLARGPSMVVSDIEAGIGLTYTLDTVRWFRRRFPRVRFVWIMGADGLATFHLWRGWRDLAAEIPVAIIARPGAAVRARFAPMARRFAAARLPESRALGLADQAPPAWVYLTAPFQSVSSTALRQGRSAGGA
jgi:nicotinate-nucleotide adenylyltransferase